MKRHGVSSQNLRRICSVAFDVGDGSCGSSLPVSPKAAEDTSDHQREPKQRRADGENQTSFEDVCAEQERSSPDKIGEDDDDDHIDDRHTGAESTEDIIPGGSEVSVAAEEEEPEATKGSEPDDETLNTEGAGDDVGAEDTDVEITSETLHKAEEQDELKDDEAETTKEEREEDNLQQSCSAEPDVDSGTTLSKSSVRVVSTKREDRVQSRSLRHLKVLQAWLVTLLKW